MKRLVWILMAAAVMAVGLSGCLIADGNSSGECCYQYEVCDTYCDPYGNCTRDCWFEESCPATCDSGGTDSNNQNGDFCYSDVDCSGEDVCVNNSCQRPDTSQRGTAGLCQACETNSDCVDPNALCIELQRDGGPAERVCTTPCDGGCPNGFECVGIDGSNQCLPEANSADVRTCADAPNLECVTASDCAAGESCVNNKCEAPDTAECTADGDCGAGEVCDRQECVPDSGAECTTRSDCASGEVCVDGVCEGGTQSCVFNNECDDGLCVDGQCYSSCSTDDECGRLEHCRQGVCRATECRGTSDCAGDEVCVDATCKPACSPDASTDTCGAGYVCTDYGYCDRDPNVECRSNAECSRDEVCLEGECRAACTCNQDCDSGTICDTGTNTCVDDGGNTPTSCQTSCDCPSGQQCSDSGECVAG